MEPIRALIVDDEPLARERVRALLERDPDVEIVGECSEGYEAVAEVRRLRPDLLFLDVQMPEKDGFGVLADLGDDAPPVVIFVTAYDQYAIRAFEVCALDYLLKPFDPDRFHQALGRAKAQIRSGQGSDSGHVRALLDALKSQSRPLERLLVKVDGRVVFLKTCEIDWIEAEGNYVRLHVGKQSYFLRETIANLEAQLGSEAFPRIHRSTIVNIDRVKELHPSFHGEYTVLLHDGTRLTLSRSYRDNLLKSSK